MNDCFFCKVQHVPAHIVWENEHLFFVLDDHPVSPGHGLLVPRRHVPSILDANDTEWQAYKLALPLCIQALDQLDMQVVYADKLRSATSETMAWFCQRALSHQRLGTKPDGYNHGVNDGAAAGQTVDHLHWHIIPRYNGDMIDPRGGVRYVIPEMGNYKIPRA